MSRPPERFLTARELADLLGVHPNYIYEQAARGKLPSYKFGGNRRFRWSEIECWLEDAGTGNSGSIPVAASSRSDEGIGA